MARLTARVKRLLQAVAKRKLTNGEMDILMRALYGEDNWDYIMWATVQESWRKEGIFIIRMRGKGIDIPQSVSDLYFTQ
ncbi:MAG: hypothetical protein BMS9Abin34_207 [Patescibacteria group bacterium]|nr:MAG: hypothetical protein BMS9Abin34_207 [Patescibacteria group bacterium]